MADHDTPEALIDALAMDDDAAAAWKELPPSHRREYVDWIDEAERDDTKAQRAAKAVEMLRRGRADL